MLPTYDSSNINKCNNSTLTNNQNVHNPPKIHINPNFCNIAAKKIAQIQDEKIQPHINPVFLYRQQQQVPKIYMNPKFFPTQNHSMPTNNAITAINATSFNDSFVTPKTTTTNTDAVQQLANTFVEKNHMEIIGYTGNKTTTTPSVLADTTTFVNKYKLDKRERPVVKLPESTNLATKKSYKPSLNKKLQTLNINGVIYKSTGTKLQRKDAKGFRGVVITPKRAVKQFSMRSRIINAKQRSLQVLRQKLVKSNIPCPIYRRLGRCRAYEAKKCNKVHDKKYVIICRKFQNGECQNNDCLLSHDISFNKMPVCRYFLQANCVRDNCPYLHKKLNANASLCPEFLRGYCPLADQCSKLHDSEIKTIVNFGQRLKDFKLNQNSKAIVPLSEKEKQKQKQRQKQKQKKIESNKNVRYFLSVDKPILDNDVIIIEDSDDDDDDDNDENQQNEQPNSGQRRREKLGDLPAFIPIS